MRARTIVISAVLAVLATIVPSSATAADWSGVVVAKDPTRGALVLALDDASARTVRTTAWKTAKIGRRVAVAASRLADGTYEATGLRVVAWTTSGSMTATVVRVRTRRLLLSAGGSLFTVRRRSHRVLQAAQAPAPGERVQASLGIVAGTVTARALEDLGKVGLVEIVGLLGAATDTTLTVQTPAGGVDVSLPADLDASGLTTGTEIALFVTVDEHGNLQAAAAMEDAAASTAEIQLDDSTGELDVAGVIVSVDPATGAITIDPGDGSPPVTCTVPTETDLSGLQQGDPVAVSCSDDGATLTASVVVSDGSILVTVSDGTGTDTVDVCSIAPGLCELIGSIVSGDGAAGNVDPCQLVPDLCGLGGSDGTGSAGSGEIDPCAILPELCDL